MFKLAPIKQSNQAFISPPPPPKAPITLEDNTVLLHHSFKPMFAESDSDPNKNEHPLTI